MRIVLKALLAILIAAGLAAFAFNVSAEPAIHIEAGAASKGVERFCSIEKYPSGGTFLKVIATEPVVDETGKATGQFVTKTAEMFVAPGLAAFLDDPRETTHLMKTHCKSEMAPYLAIAQKAIEDKKVGYEAKY